jgi:chaperonin GroEL
MAHNKELIFGNAARDKILNGMLKCGRAVATTYGPRGRFTVVFKGSTPYLTKDGIRSLKAINFADELEEIGASLIKEASERANFVNGDGSTATAILCATLCQTANELIKTGIDASDIREGFSAARDAVLKHIDTYSKKISSADDIFAIAKVSANNDEEIAGMIRDAFTNIGDDGIVVITDSFSRTGQSAVTYTTGCSFDRGFLSSINADAKSETIEFQHPLVLLSSKPVDKFEEIIPFCKFAESEKKPLVIIAPDFGDDATAGFFNNIEKKTLSGTLILAPGVSKREITEKLDDLSVMLDASVLHTDVTLDSFKLDSHFGKCELMVVHSKKTEIISPVTNETRLATHIDALRKRASLDKVDEALSEFESEQIRSRIAHLSGGIATIHVGSRTSVELGEKKDRYEDAINAVRGAIAGGIVPGGSTALLVSALTIADKWATGRASSAHTASLAFLDAIIKPAQILIRSTGRKTDKVISEIMKHDGTYGFNSKTGEVEDLIAAGIVDPTKVIKNSLIYAENVAESFMMIDCAIVSKLGNLSINSDPVMTDEFFNLE